MIRDTETQKCKQYAWLGVRIVGPQYLPCLISVLFPVASISGLEAGSESAPAGERISRPRLGGGSRRQAGGPATFDVELRVASAIQSSYYTTLHTHCCTVNLCPVSLHSTRPSTRRSHESLGKVASNRNNDAQSTRGSHPSTNSVTALKQKGVWIELV
jgi:hypothetical protein